MTLTSHHMNQVTSYVQSDTEDYTLSHDGRIRKDISNMSKDNAYHSSRLNAQHEGRAFSSSSRSPNDIMSIQVGYSTSSVVSIGSPRSVFVPVSSFERKEKLLPPSTSTSDMNMNIKGGHSDKSNEHGKVGGLLRRWQAMEGNNAKALAAKSKPVEYRFKPIPNAEMGVNNNMEGNIVVNVNEVQKDPHPEVEKSKLSSRARMRQHVPFTHIIVKDMDDDSSCTTVSSMSFDPSEFALDAMENFATKHETDLIANKALIDETNELLQRIARHNIGGEEGDEGDNVVDQHTYGIQPRPMSDVDKGKLVFGSNQLLSEVEDLSLPEDIAALVKADERENSEQDEARRLNILDEMDSDFSSFVKLRNDYMQQNQQQGVSSPDIEALVEDTDLSFDDLRVDSHDNGEKGEL